MALKTKKASSGISVKGKMTKPKKVILCLALVIVAVIGYNIVQSVFLNQTVEIVELKNAVAQDGQVSEDNMTKGTMSRADYLKREVITLSSGVKKREIILWEDRKTVANAYASYYIRQQTPLYWDGLSKETPKKYAYLYKMDGELLKLDISADQFGNMLVPGDKVNIRATYTDNIYTLPDDQTYALQQKAGIKADTAIQKTEKLFNNTTVLDILNSNGESIFDLYYKLLALPKAQQEEKLASSDFQDAVKPVTVLLNVTPEEADHYTSIQSKGAQYSMTLLPRTGGNVITEALNQLQTGNRKNADSDSSSSKSSTK